MSHCLALHLLGPPELELNNAPVSIDRRKSLAPLAVLALQWEPHRREYMISLCRRLVARDPLNEASHHLLMEIYIQAGQHNAALRPYQICERILRKKLGVDPQPEMRALYKRVRK